MKKSEKRQNNADRLFDGVGRIDDDLIYEAESYHKARRAGGYVRFVPVIVSMTIIILALVVALPLAVPSLMGGNQASEMPADENSSETAKDEKDTNQNSGIPEETNNCNSEGITCVETKAPEENEMDSDQNTTEHATGDNSDDQIDEVTGEEVTPDYSDSSSSDVIEYSFSTVSDIETYLNTGSTEPSDYSQPPTPGFDGFGSVDGIPLNKVVLPAYRPLKLVLGIDTDSTGEIVSVSFKYTGEVDFSYYFENSFIRVVRFQKTSKTTSDYYKAFCEKNFTEYQPLDYSEYGFTKDGYVSRDAGGQEVVYKVKGGIPVSAGVMIGNYLVEVMPCLASDVADAAQSYESFVSSLEMGDAALLFSADDSVLDEVILRITKGLEK